MINSTLSLSYFLSLLFRLPSLLSCVDIFKFLLDVKLELSGLSGNAMFNLTKQNLVALEYTF